MQNQSEIKTYRKSISNTDVAIMKNVLNALNKVNNQ